MAQSQRTTPLKDLNAFQRDLLVTVKAIGPAKGLEIKDRLDEEYGEEINHGRLYPNLDQLAASGFISVEEIDGRTNHYWTTTRAHRALDERVEWTLKNIGGDDE